MPSVEEAKTTLADREGISRKNAQRLIGVWSPASPGGFAGSAAVAEWAASKAFFGVVWTALGPSFPDMRGKPSCDQVIAYLSKLDGDTKRLAEEYVRRTPAQIRTSYRARIEQELGWTSINPS